jgi:hypothetical protein
MRVLRHARRLGGGSSALEPTEAGIAVTNKVRHRTGTHRLDHRAAAVPSFDEQHRANTHVVGQQAMALQGAIVARSDSAPPDSDAHSHPRGWALLQAIRATTSQRSCMQTIQHAYIAHNNRKVDQTDMHCYCYTKK